MTTGLKVWFSFLCAIGVTCGVLGSTYAQPAPATSAPPVLSASGGAGIPSSGNVHSRAEYEAGRLLFAEGDYSGALVKLQRSFELSGDPRVLWNMIVCEKLRHRYARMHSLLLKYLEKGAGVLTEAERVEAQQLIEALQSFMSPLTLVVSQPGATVVIDGEILGTTPLSEDIRVDLGTRQLRVTKPRYRDWTQSLHVVGATGMQVRVELERVTETAMIVVTGPARSAIHLDGRPVGTQRWDGMVPAGMHQLQLTAPNYKPYNAEIFLRDGENRRIAVTLESEKKNRLWWWVTGGAVLAGAIVGGIALLAPRAEPPGTTTPPGEFGVAIVP